MLVLDPAGMHNSPQGLLIMLVLDLQERRVIPAEEAAGQAEVYRARHVHYAELPPDHQDPERLLG